MRRKMSFILASLLLSSSTVCAQGDTSQQSSLGAFGGRIDERAVTRILYVNRETNDFLGQLAITYGQPLWKVDYEDPAMFDQMTKGQVWRMGNNFWTVLDTNLPLKINGKDVPAGDHYLGVHRSEDGGTWSLAFIDPAKARSLRLDASEIAKATVEFMAPMSFARTEKKAEKVIIALDYPEEDPADVTLRVAWGDFQLTAPVEVMGLE